MQTRQLNSNVWTIQISVEFKCHAIKPAIRRKSSTRMPRQPKCQPNSNTGPTQTPKYCKQHLEPNANPNQFSLNPMHTAHTIPPQMLCSLNPEPKPMLNATQHKSHHTSTHVNSTGFSSQPNTNGIHTSPQSKCPANSNIGPTQPSA